MARIRTGNNSDTYRVRINKVTTVVPTPREGDTHTTTPCAVCGTTTYTYRSYKYSRFIGWELVCTQCQENYVVYSTEKK